LVDENALRDLIRQILEDDGTVLAGNCHEALSICEQRDGKIDLLITDVVGPR